MFSAITKLALFAAAALQGVYAAQNQLTQVTGDIGPNPNNVGMFVYKPSKLASPTPLIVAIHYCQGSAEVRFFFFTCSLKLTILAYQAYFTGTQYATLADTYGFIVVYPNSPRSGSCFAPTVAGRHRAPSGACT